MEKWPDWKLLLAKFSIVWCIAWGIYGLLLVIVNTILFFVG